MLGGAMNCSIVSCLIWVLICGTLSVEGAATFFENNRDNASPPETQTKKCCSEEQVDAKPRITCPDTIKTAPALKNLDSDDMNVTKVVIHPSFNSKTQENDLALLEAAKPFQLDDTSSPVCLKTINDGSIACDSQCFLVAYNEDQFLRKSLAVLSKETCVNVYSSYGFKNLIKEYMECAQDSGDNRNCHGDSGSPMSCANKKGHVTLAALLSWGWNCPEPSTPAVFIRIAPFITWIRSYVKQNEGDLQHCSKSETTYIDEDGVKLYIFIPNSKLYATQLGSGTTKTAPAKSTAKSVDDTNDSAASTVKSVTGLTKSATTTISVSGSSALTNGTTKSAEETTKSNDSVQKLISNTTTLVASATKLSGSTANVTSSTTTAPPEKERELKDRATKEATESADHTSTQDSESKKHTTMQWSSLSSAFVYEMMTEKDDEIKTVTEEPDTLNGPGRQPDNTDSDPLTIHFTPDEDQGPLDDFLIYLNLTKLYVKRK